MLLQALKLSDDRDEEKVLLLVGPNGAGKSTMLRKLAMQYKNERPIAIVCNTAYDRFVNLRGVKRLSASRSFGAPRTVVKAAVAKALASDGSSFFQISTVLEFCGYRPRFGIRLVQTWRDEWKAEQLNRDYTATERDPELQHAIEVSRLRVNGPIFWVDGNLPAFEFSIGRDLGTVLEFERRLQTHHFLSQIKLFLEKVDGTVIELKEASSGELALISSLIFLIINIGKNYLVLIDEPENSLHPKWQREYVDLLLATFRYQQITAVIATHAPLIVTGALPSKSDVVDVYSINEGEAEKLDLHAEGEPQSSIEEILWRAFEVVTPANHYVSERLVEAVSEFEAGRRSQSDVYVLIESMKAESFDSKQSAFFDAVKALVDDVSENPENSGGPD